MSLRDLFNKHVIIQRRTTAASSVSAAGSYTWISSVFNVHCTIQPAGTTELERFNKTTAEMTHTMFCDVGHDIKARDRIVDGSITYQIVGKPMNDAGRGHHFAVPLLERDET